MRFALLEAKIALAKALRVVEIQSCERTEVPINLGKLKVLTPKQGIWIRVVRRSWQTQHPFIFLCKKSNLTDQ